MEPHHAVTGDFHMGKPKSLRQVRDSLLRRSLGGSGDIPWVSTFRDVNKYVGELVGMESTMMIMIYSKLPPQELLALVNKTFISKMIRLLQVNDPTSKNPLYALTRNIPDEFPFVEEGMEKMKATYRVVTPETPEEPKNP